MRKPVGIALTILAATAVNLGFGSAADAAGNVVAQKKTKQVTYSLTAPPTVKAGQNFTLSTTALVRTTPDANCFSTVTTGGKDAGGIDNSQYANGAEASGTFRASKRLGTIYQVKVHCADYVGKTGLDETVTFSTKIKVVK